MAMELINDNGGICRFHRKWAEQITGQILQSHYALNVDFKARQFELAKAIYAREGSKSQPWASERIAEMLLGFLQHWRDNGLRDPELDDWLERFQVDKKAAMQQFWQAIYRGQKKAFSGEWPLESAETRHPAGCGSRCRLISSPPGTPASSPAP